MGDSDEKNIKNMFHCFRNTAYSRFNADDSGKAESSRAAVTLPGLSYHSWSWFDYLFYIKEIRAV